MVHVCSYVVRQYGALYGALHWLACHNPYSIFCHHTARRGAPPSPTLPPQPAACAQLFCVPSLLGFPAYRSLRPPLLPSRSPLPGHPLRYSQQAARLPTNNTRHLSQQSGPRLANDPGYMSRKNLSLERLIR